MEEEGVEMAAPIFLARLLCSKGDQPDGAVPGGGCRVIKLFSQETSQRACVMIDGLNAAGNGWLRRERGQYLQGSSPAG